MTTGSGHYWASSDLNTTGENVGITLDSMCDIIAENDVSNGNSVVFIPGDIENGEKGHFALGEGSGGGAEIDASQYQVLTGDGEQGAVGAQGGATAQESNKIYLKDKVLGPNIPTMTDGGDPILGVDTGSFSIASNALGHTHTETVYDEELEDDVETQVEDDGWKATIEDYGKVKVSGKATIEIGELGADYSANAKFWNNHPAGPDIKIKGAARIEMLGKADPTESDSYAWGIPVVSMRGNCLIDMCDHLGSYYLSGGQCYQQDPLVIRREIFNEVSSYSDPTKGTGIFNSRNAPLQNAPILQLKGRSIISLRDEAILKMTESSCLTLEGNAYFKVNGGGYTGGDTDKYALKGNNIYQHAEFNAGTVFILDGNGYDDNSGDSSFGVMAVIGRQIMFSNEGDNSTTTSPQQIGSSSYSVSNAQHGNVINSIGYLWSRSSYCNPGYFYTYGGGPRHNRYDDTYGIRKIGFEGDASLRSGYNGITKNGKQTILLEGTTKVKIGGTHTSGEGSGQSVTLIDIGGYDSSVSSVNIKAGNNGATHVDYSGEYNSSINHVVHTQSGAQSIFNFQTASGAKSEIFIEAQGNTCITAELAVGSLYKPSGVPSLGNKCFGMYLGPARTDIDCKWNQLQTIWDGYDHFIQVDGETHFENWSGKIVIRSSYDDIFNPPHGTCYPYFEDKSKSVTLESSHTKIKWNVKNPDYPTAPDTSTATPTSQEITDAMYKYSKPQYTGQTPWGVSSVYDNCSNIELGDERTSGEYYYVMVALSGYQVKEGNITITFKDSTEYTTLENLSDAIAAHPEKFSKQWTTEEVIGFSSGTMGTRTQTADGWQYTISNAVSIRRQKADNPWETYYAYGKTNFDNYAITQYHYWPVSVGMTYNQMPSGLQSLISRASNSNLNGMITYINSSSRGISINNLIYTDVVVDVAYVQQPFDLEYDINFKAESLQRVDWLLPSVQQSELLTGPFASMWNRSPIVQLRDPANISIHGKFNTTVRYYSFTTSETYDVSDMAQAVSDFINGPDYDGLLEAIDEITLTPYSNYKTYETELWKIIKIVEGSEAGHYTVHYTVKPKGWNEYIESTTDCPVVEITDDSEVRFYNGSRIKGYKPQFGETTYEFSSSDSNEEPVSFTLSELKALKQLLNSL